MKKPISLLVLVFILFGTVQSQETKYVAGGFARQMALGGSPTNAYLMDYTNINTNPAWAAKYGDLIYSELGFSFNGYNASGQSAGFTYAVSKGLVVGLSIGKQEGPIFSNNSYGSSFGGNTTNADYFIGGINNLYTAAGMTTPFDFTNTTAIQNLRPLQVYGALKLSGLTVGAAIYRSSWSGSNDRLVGVGATQNTKDEVSMVQTGFKAGALFDMNVILLDVSALLRINSSSNKTTPPTPPPGSQRAIREIKATGTEIGLNARLFMKLSDKFTLVPMARFSTFGYEPEISDTISSAPGRKFNSKPNKYNRTEIEVGVGTNITVTGGRIFAGVSFESISLKNDYSTFRGSPGVFSVLDTSVMQTTKNSTSVLSLPKVNLGAEFDIASWLTGRVGYFKAFSGETITTEAPGVPKSEQKSTYEFRYMPACSLAVADQLLSLGLGLHFDRLSLDGYLCEAWLGDGPALLSGVENAMFGVLSLSYNFQ